MSSGIPCYLLFNDVFKLISNDNHKFKLVKVDNYNCRCVYFTLSFCLYWSNQYSSSLFSHI